MSPACLRSTTPLLALALLAASCAGIVELEPGDPVSFVQQPQTSLILDRDGDVLAELHGEQDRRDVPLEQVSPQLVQAVLSIEDRRYFLHAGVDLASIVRAALANLDAGEIEQGGSTITQQYVKNTMTGPVRTYERKLREAALAYQLEQQYSKEEILERYLNTVYFGRGAYGVFAAAKAFFGTSPDRLTLAQAAQLAGMIQSPSRYDPAVDAEAAAQRRGAVLDAMVSTGQISSQEAEEAEQADLDLVDPTEEVPRIAPYFLAEVKRLLQHDPQNSFGVLGSTVDERADRLFTGGLRIITTLDPTMQAQAEGAVAETLTEDVDPSAALVAIDPQTGAVRALVGGRDYDDPDDPNARFNLATQGRRQPGSSFKPFVLATALTRGVGLDRVFPGGACADLVAVDWEPCNYGGTSYAPLTLREATVRSVNTVYARLAVELGPTAIVQTARRLGLTSDLPQVYSLALGTAEVTPLEMASAYGTFATLGRHHPPYLVERIETADGEVLFEQGDRSYQAIEESVAFLVTQTLQDVVRRGTGVRASIDRPQAGKTGTSQNNADAWFIGYTPDLVAAVWVGFAEGQIPMRPPTTRQVVEGGRWPAEIWHAFASRALDGVDATPFPTPDVDLVQVEVDATRNCLPNPYTPPDLIEIRTYPQGAEPTERCLEPTGPPIDDVPGVVGLPLEVARRLLEDQGFVLEVRPVVSLLYPPGTVTRQRPDAGGTTLESDGNAVILWVGTNVRTRSQVPDVVGLSREDAVATLEASGWVVEVRIGCSEEGCPEDARPGTVWAQDPGSGSTERDHSVVTIRLVPDASDSP